VNKKRHRGKNCPCCQNVLSDRAVVAVTGDGAADSADETDDDKLEEDEAIDINYKSRY
tara:strand:- start:781 stop:954 length:174 start_codon:yes stop_codon:yes gene_type:complete